MHLVEREIRERIEQLTEEQARALLQAFLGNLLYYDQHNAREILERLERVVREHPASYWEEDSIEGPSSSVLKEKNLVCLPFGKESQRSNRGWHFTVGSPQTEPLTDELWDLWMKSTDHLTHLVVQTHSPPSKLQQLLGVNPVKSGLVKKGVGITLSAEVDKADGLWTHPVLQVNTAKNQYVQYIIPTGSPITLNNGRVAVQIAIQQDVRIQLQDGPIGNGPYTAETVTSKLFLRKPKVQNG